MRLFGIVLYPMMRMNVTFTRAKCDRERTLADVNIQTGPRASRWLLHHKTRISVFPWRVDLSERRTKTNSTVFSWASQGFQHSGALVPTRFRLVFITTGHFLAEGPSQWRVNGTQESFPGSEFSFFSGSLAVVKVSGGR